MSIMKPIMIVEPNPEWPNEFDAVAERIRAFVGADVQRIDHIGSTSIAGLAAKDIIDIQITVKNIDCGACIAGLKRAGFIHRQNVTCDSLVGTDADSKELGKHYFREPMGERPVHIHIREQGRLNQEYALVFRDYLRADAVTREAYAVVKKALANRFSYDTEAYYQIKDPFMDSIYQAAKMWAQLNSWRPDEHYK